MNNTPWDIIAAAVRTGAVRSDAGAPLFIGCGLFVKLMDLPRRGDCVMTHAHHYAHLTLLAKGALLVSADGQETLYRAPAFIVVREGAHHGMVAFEDGTQAYCIHATDAVADDALGKPFGG